MQKPGQDVRHERSEVRKLHAYVIIISEWNDGGNALYIKEFENSYEFIHQI